MRAQTTRKMWAIPYDHADPSHCGREYGADRCNAIPFEAKDNLDSIKQKMRMNSEWEPRGIECVIGYWVVTEAELEVLDFISGSSPYQWEDPANDSLHILLQGLAQLFHFRR